MNDEKRTVWLITSQFVRTIGHGESDTTTALARDALYGGKECPAFWSREAARKYAQDKNIILPVFTELEVRDE